MINSGSIVYSASHTLFSSCPYHQHLLSVITNCTFDKTSLYWNYRLKSKSWRKCFPLIFLRFHWFITAFFVALRKFVCRSLFKNNSSHLVCDFSIELPLISRISLRSVAHPDGNIDGKIIWMENFSLNSRGRA